jgi:hypothetical protein
VIKFKDLESKETAKANAEWLEALGNGTKLVKPRFGVVVHRMPTDGLQLPERKKEAIERITEENDLTAKGYCVDRSAVPSNAPKTRLTQKEGNKSPVLRRESLAACADNRSS